MDEELKNQLELDKQVEMSDKQRIRCLLMVQLFFAGLGDDKAIPLKDQISIANRVKIEHAAKVKQKQKNEQLAKKEERKERKRQRRLAQQGSDVEDLDEDNNDSEQDSDEYDSEESSGSGTEDSEKARRRAKRREKKAKLAELRQINTDTQVQTDSKAKRDKLDDAVRKILMYKDMKASANQGDQDPDMKRNQDFIRMTINQYSGQITAPTNIVRRKLCLTGYYMNEGVCNSLNNYFGQLTFDQLQVLELRENGLKDSTMATLLSSLSEQRALKQITYSENEMGAQTADQISKILLWPNPTNLEKLSMCNLKTTSFAMAVVLAALKNNRKLITFEAEKIVINNKQNFDYLCQFLKSNKSIKSLRLSWNSFLPKQIIEVMNLIKRRKTIEFLDLSYNNLAPDPRHQALVKQFVNTMRRFILRTQIFHLDLTAMSLGKTVGKLVQSIKQSSTLNAVHLSNNNVGLDYVYNMDKELGILETQGNRINRFRPLERERKSQIISTENRTKENSQARNSARQDNARLNYGNTGADKIASVELESFTGEEEQTDHQNQEAERTLQKDLIEELKRIQAAKDAKEAGREAKKLKVATAVAPVLQDPLIYNRFLNHPEFCFPLRFQSKTQGRTEEGMSMDQLIKDKMKILRAKAAAAQNQTIEVNDHPQVLDERQDTVYFSQDFTNKWSKIEMMTNKQIKKGKKGIQPDWSGVLGREGIVNTHHETCWVCEKRKYVLMAVNMDSKSSKHTWGQPINNPKEKLKLRKKYLPSGQMPGQLNDYPILISSLNDWFPMHMMPVMQYAMLFDYTLMQDISRDTSLHINTKDSVQKFKQGYDAVLQDASNIKKMDASNFKMYRNMWRTYILKNLIYPHDTLFIDFPSPQDEVDPESLFMFAAFVKPGKHRAILYDPFEDVWYKRDFYVDEREEELPKFAQFENITADKENVMQSILKEWHPDSQSTYRRCIEHDEENWKIENTQFIKDPQDYAMLRALIVKHFGTLKDVFLHLASKDEFPTIEMFGTEEFSKHMGLIDGKHVKKKDINRMFIAANVSDKDNEHSNPVNALVRYEFIEFLVRMAKYKYKEAGLVATTAESFERLMNELVTPFFELHCQDWQPFRDKYLLNTVIDNLMYVNKKGLENIFIKMASQNKNKAFNITNCFQVMRQLNLNLADTAVTYAFGMSHQTVVNESKNYTAYDRLIFVEFVEYLCRILYNKFSSDYESNQLKDFKTGAGQAKDLSEAIENSFPNSQHNSSRKTKPKDEEQEKAALEKELWAFKEFCCHMLDTFFEQHGLEFMDPDEDVVLSDSQESEFVYDLPSGYNSQDEDNPEAISVLSSGNSSEQIDEEPQIDLSNFRDMDTSQISMLNLDSLQGQISKAGKPTLLSPNRLAHGPQKEREKIRQASARRQRKEILQGQRENSDRTIN